jgi:thiol-disulfide isomerase/thioredoxin
MNNIVISFFFLFLTTLALGQPKNQKVWDEDLNKKVLVGLCDRHVLEQGDFGEIFQQEYSGYQPDENTVKQLKQIIRSHPDAYKIVVIFGEWCSDSQREVPRFFKVMDAVGFPADQVEIYAVNRKKQGVTVDLSGYQVQYVPLFIINESGMEKGRIIESPEQSLEKDWLAILKK